MSARWNIGRVRIGRLAQGTIFGSVGLLARAVVQAGYLLVLSRWMGVDGYGLFSGSIAAVMLVAPLAGWGVSLLLSQAIALDRTRSRSMWASAIAQTAVSGTALTLLVVLISATLLRTDVGLTAMLLLGIGELVLLPMAQAATSICFAVDRGAAAAVAICLVPVGRLALAVALWSCGVEGTAPLVALSHFLGSVLGFAGSFLLIAGISGVPLWRDAPRLSRTLPQGSSYALGALLNTSYQEVDKVAMLQLLGAHAVGPYTVAFRVISVAVLPISALVSAGLPRLFAATEATTRLRALRAIALAAVGYGIVAAGGAALAAPLMPLVFGSGFADSAGYLLLFCPWPALFALHQSAAIGLTTSGRQTMRAGLEGIGFLLVIGLNVALLPKIGAKASILALLVAEGFVAATCYLVLRRR